MRDVSEIEADIAMCVPSKPEMPLSAMKRVPVEEMSFLGDTRVEQAIA